MYEKFILIKKDVLDFLASKKLMILATFGDHPWIVGVYYSFDDDLNLYFISNPATIHGRHLEKNKKERLLSLILNKNLPMSKKGYKFMVM